mmetsp:Transcript_21398/g.67083  ORF Transcript_21398/g.67083 Transcript_21398/m.67083 type:complete len:336 (+) Transcript_21398:857-1864(+)
MRTPGKHTLGSLHLLTTALSTAASSVAGLPAGPSNATPAVHAPAPARSTGDLVQDHLIIITTPQRSGSHFLAGLLNRGGASYGIHGGNEHPPAGQDADACYASLMDLLRHTKTIIAHMSNWCGSRKNRFRLVSAVGEKLRQNGSVQVLHGWRSALMIVSDNFLALAADKEIGGHVSNPKGAGSELIATYRNLTEHYRLPVGDAEANYIELAQRIRTVENTELEFLRLVGLTQTGQLMEYSYESLLLPERHSHLTAIFQFLTRSTSAAVPTAMAERALRDLEHGKSAELEGQTLHPPTCSSRVRDWPRLRAMLNGTYTLGACDRLEEAFGGEGGRE